MKTTSFKGAVESAYGEKLAEPVAFAGTFQELEENDSIPEAEQLTAEDIRNVVNAKRKAAARAKATTAALEAKGITAPEKDSPITLWRNMFNTLKVAFKSEDRARKVTSDTLGYSEAEAKEKDSQMRAEAKAKAEAEAAAKETVNA